MSGSQLALSKQVILIHHIQLMAQYNQRLNERLYATAGQLSDDILNHDQGAFFKSISGTLNHIMVGDLVWLKRFANHPAAHPALDYLHKVQTPKSLDQILYTDFSELDDKRKQLDQVIIDWCQQLTDNELATPLTYHNIKGEPATKNLGSLILHLFNHQTHHRGQLTTLLSQNGLDIGETDLLALIPDANGI